MRNSVLPEHPRGAGAARVAVPTASALVLAACAYGVDNGFNPSWLDGGLHGATSGIGGAMGSAGQMVGSSSSATEGAGGAGGTSSTTGSAGAKDDAGFGAGGSTAAGGASGAAGGAGSAAGGSSGGQAGTGGQAGGGGQGGAAGRDGGPGGMGGKADAAGGAGGMGDGAAGTGGAAGGTGGASGAAGSGVVVRDAGPLVSVDDSVTGTGTNQFNYAGTWGHCAPCTTATTPPLFNTSNSWADGTTAAAQILTFAFVGSEILFYGVQDPRNGIGAFSIDGGAETNVDFYAALRGGNRLVWTSPFLARGAHTLRVHPTGTKNASSAGITITVDRVEVH